MKHFRIATVNTPEVIFDLENGLISLIGQSTTLNSLDFYKNLILDLKHCTNDIGNVCMDINLSIFNTSSAKCIFDILRELKRKQVSGNEITINWFYDSHDSVMLEMGKDFSALSELEFNFIEQIAFAI